MEEVKLYHETCNPDWSRGGDNTLVFGYWLLQNVMGLSAANQAIVVPYPSVTGRIQAERAAGTNPIVG